MVLSKSIIGSHYKELGFTWLIYFDFAKNVLRQGFYLFETRLFLCVRETPAFPRIYTDTIYG